MVELLYQEIMMLRDLDHDNVVQYLGYGLDDTEGMIKKILEYVSGGNAASCLALHGTFDEPISQYFTRKICSGIAYIHSKNILHRVKHKKGFFLLSMCLTSLTAVLNCTCVFAPTWR